MKILNDLLMAQDICKVEIGVLNPPSRGFPGRAKLGGSNPLFNHNTMYPQGRLWALRVSDSCQLHPPPPSSSQNYSARWGYSLGRGLTGLSKSQKLYLAFQ